MADDTVRLTEQEREALERHLGGGMAGYIQRIRSAHGPQFKGVTYTGCRCGEVACPYPRLIVHMDDLVRAYELKVQDFAEETRRSSELTARLAADRAERDETGDFYCSRCGVHRDAHNHESPTCAYDPEFRAPSFNAEVLRDRARQAEAGRRRAEQALAERDAEVDREREAMLSDFRRQMEQQANNYATSTQRLRDDAALAEVRGQMKHITAEVVRGDQPPDEKEEFIAALRAKVSHVEAERDDWHGRFIRESDARCVAEQALADLRAAILALADEAEANPTARYVHPSRIRALVGESGAAALDRVRAEAKADALRPLDLLFSGGPDTPCRTTYPDDVECVEVPMADLRAAFDLAYRADRLSGGQS